ncbi:hypothetical protein AVEN_10500-1 [Araneus ventricosus]|uniref:Uncharacterized protein n=1 Tax=Araneus ventricosus TaxID=182803 RepID=A0A4Y2JEC7_ARAVE|nr:hypothetical protein AVEN_10500-1 [Araneus ventricosus]
MFSAKFRGGLHGKSDEETWGRSSKSGRGKKFSLSVSYLCLEEMLRMASTQPCFCFSDTCSSTDGERCSTFVEKKCRRWSAIPATYVQYAGEKCSMARHLLQMSMLSG